jgi:uncharacterized membrane protein HdeD (DUF308 family)
MKDLNIKNSELFTGFVILAAGFILFVAVTNSIRYVGLVFLVVGIVYFFRVFNSKSNQSNDESLKSKTRDQVDKFRRKQ